MNAPNQHKPTPTGAGTGEAVSRPRSVKPPRRSGLMVWLIAVGVVGVVGFALGRFLSIHDHREADATTDASAAEAAGPDTDVQMYTCSMHPQYQSPDPDDHCPYCGMELIPVPQDKEDAEENDGERPRLRLTERAAALMQVSVQPATRRDVRVPVALYGRIQYDETRLRDVTVKASGWITKLHADFVGAAVRKGDPLFDLYSPELYAAQEEYLIAWRRSRSGAASGDADLLESARTRLTYFDITEAQVAELEARGAAHQTITIVSPHDGVVIERQAYEGMRVEPNTRTYRLADLSRLWVQFEAYESDLPWIEPGRPVTFTTQTRPGESFEGRVVFIDPMIDERKRTARVRLEVDNAEGWLKPGMFVEGQIQGSLGDTPLVVPASAPLITGRRAVVYVQLPERDRPTYEPRRVTLGPRAGDWYVVRDGLREGELVVTHGAFKIDSELQIRGRPSMMQPAGGPSPSHDHGRAATTVDPDDDHDTSHDHAIVRATDDEVAAYPLDTCVVSGLALDSMGGPVRIEHDGQAVLFCCDACLPQFEADPQRYLDTIDAAREAGNENP